mgnify:CR=1 FL=1
MRLCSLSVRTRLRLHPIQVSRPPRTGAGLLPGGVGAGASAGTPVGKFCEDAEGFEEEGAGVEGGVNAIFALWWAYESMAVGDPPPDARFLFLSFLLFFLCC